MKLRLLGAAVLVLATLVTGAAAAAQAPGHVRFYGEPGSVTINGLAAPEGTTIQVKTSDGGAVNRSPGGTITSGGQREPRIDVYRR